MKPSSCDIKNLLNPAEEDMRLPAIKDLLDYSIPKRSNDMVQAKRRMGNEIYDLFMSKSNNSYWKPFRHRDFDPCSCCLARSHKSVSKYNPSNNDDGYFLYSNFSKNLYNSNLLNLEFNPQTNLAKQEASKNFKSVQRRKRVSDGITQCHSCHTKETPEWRRGPNGSRTLCNACGLIFAKYEKKNRERNLMENTTPTSIDILFLKEKNYKGREGNMNSYNKP